MGKLSLLPYMTAGLGSRGGSTSNFDPKPYKMHFLLYFYPTFQQKSGGRLFLECLQGGGVPGRDAIECAKNQLNSYVIQCAKAKLSNVPKKEDVVQCAKEERCCPIYQKSP